MDHTETLPTGQQPAPIVTTLATPAVKLKAALAESEGEDKARRLADRNKVDADLRDHATAIMALKAKSIECILKIGEHLEAAHQTLAGAGRDGCFHPWVEAHCGFSRSTAYNYLAAFRVFKKCPTVGHFDVKAIYLLSADSCPEGATKAAIRKSKDGTHITHTMAADIKRRHEKIESRKHDDDHDDLDGDVHVGDDASHVRFGPYAEPQDDHIDDDHDDAAEGDDDHPALELVDSTKKDIEKLVEFVRKADKGLAAQRERAVVNLRLAKKYVSEAANFFRPKRVRRRDQAPGANG